MFKVDFEMISWLHSKFKDISLREKKIHKTGRLRVFSPVFFWGVLISWINKKQLWSWGFLPGKEWVSYPEGAHPSTLSDHSFCLPLLEISGQAAKLRFFTFLTHKWFKNKHGHGRFLWLHFQCFNTQCHPLHPPVCIFLSVSFPLFLLPFNPFPHPAFSQFFSVNSNFLLLFSCFKSPFLYATTLYWVPASY